MTRIVFSKKGYAKYISHLDLTRCRARIIARAEIPIWYTQGFNPHPYMVFSAALPIGVCGENELMDIKLVNPPQYPAMLKAMNAAAPDGISFSGIYDSDREFKYIDKALYTLKVPKDIADDFEAFTLKDKIPAVKKTKSGETEIDLKTEMSLKKVFNNDEETVFEIIAPCGNERNISPVLLTSAFTESTAKRAVFSLTRTAFLDENGNIFR